MRERTSSARYRRLSLTLTYSSAVSRSVTLLPSSLLQPSPLLFSSLLTPALLPLSPFHSVNFPPAVLPSLPSPSPPTSVVAAVMSPRFTKQVTLRNYQVGSVINLTCADTTADEEGRLFAAPACQPGEAVDPSINKPASHTGLHTNDGKLLYTLYPVSQALFKSDIC